VIGPCARIFVIPDIMTEIAETEHVLNVIPCNAAEGVVAEETGNKNAHDLSGCRTYKSVPTFFIKIIENVFLESWTSRQAVAQREGAAESRYQRIP
jgi:hypothetical protein